jgi:hypothetical protein
MARRDRRLVGLMLGMLAAFPAAPAAQDSPPAHAGNSTARSGEARVTLRGDFLFYGDNTEFRNPFREGETIFGSAVRLYGVARVNDQVDVSFGFVGATDFGGSDAFRVARPLMRLTVRGARSSFSFGTFVTPWRARMSGAPDRSGPHGLLPALQVETLTFTRPAEAGLQWTFAGRRLQHDMWIDWQRLNTAEHRERFDAGAAGTIALARGLSLPFQLHVVHEGGQLFASGAVRDSAAAAVGIRLAGRAGIFETAALEACGLASHDVPDRERPDATRNGAAFLGRASLERAGWIGHVLFWRGDDFVKDEGDPNYQSIRRDGTRYRGIRDYAEAGVTRAFRLDEHVSIAVSGRLHRVENHYEYSYRIVGAAALKRPQP